MPPNQLMQQQALLRQSQQGATAGGWNTQAAAKARALNLTSAQEFPTLGGTAEEQVVMAESSGATTGFWERPPRPVKVGAGGGEGNAAGSWTGSTSSRQHGSTGSKANGDDGAGRLERIEELSRQCNLQIEEPVMGFLQTLSCSADVLDYLQAYHGESPNVRRFAEAFIERGLGASADADKEASKGQKESAENAAKASRRKRGRGKEVDPSLLGFIAPPRSG